MSAEDLEKYEAEMELQLYREYRDVVGIFKYVVETDRRFYLCNQVDVKARTEAGDVFFEVSMTDAWVWDMYRPARFAKNVKVLTFKDVNVEALRRAVALLDLSPAYVLTDGFPVDGLGVPGLAVWKGDRVAACIAAASVLAKVTRDRIMTELDGDYPAYDFKTHKGYITDEHTAALTAHGPSPIHRMRFVNVRRAAGLEPAVAVQNEEVAVTLEEAR